MSRRVDPCFENRQPPGVEEVADPREQFRFVRQVDDQLEAFSQWRGAHAHDRHLRVDMAVQHACVPGDVGTGMAQVVRRVELAQEAFGLGFGNAVTGQDGGGPGTHRVDARAG